MINLAPATNYEVQPGVDEQVRLGKKIEDAIELRGDLTLVKLTLPPPIVYLLAIKPNNHNQFSCEIDENFARYIAQNQEYCQNLKNQNIGMIEIGYYKLDDNKLQYTGYIATKLAGNDPISFNKHYPYNCFAAAVENDANLRSKLASGNFSKVYMGLAKDNQVDIKTIPGEIYKVNLPILNIEDTEQIQEIKSSSVFSLK